MTTKKKKETELTKPRLKAEPGLTDAFVRLFKQGVFITDACKELDVPLQCFKDWMRWGNLSDEKGSAAKEPYRSFAHEVTKARAGWERSLVAELGRQARDARYASDVIADDGETVLHRAGDIILNPKGYVARPGKVEAIKFLLQVQNPKRYAPQLRVLYEGQLNAALVALERGLPPEWFARALDIIQAAEVGAGDGDADPGSAGPSAPPGAPPPDGETPVRH